MKRSNYIKIHEKHITACLDVVFFKEDGVTFAYAPALEFVGYGMGEDEAKKSFEIVFHEYLRYGMENSTLDDDLRDHGWTKKKVEEFDSPQYPTIIQNNPRLREVVSKDHSKVSERFNYSFC